MAEIQSVKVEVHCCRADCAAGICVVSDFFAIHTYVLIKTLSTVSPLYADDSFPTESVECRCGC